MLGNHRAAFQLLLGREHDRRGAGHSLTLAWGAVLTCKQLFFCSWGEGWFLLSEHTGQNELLKEENGFTVRVVKAPSMLGKYLWTRREVEVGSNSVILLKARKNKILVNRGVALVYRSMVTFLMVVAGKSGGQIYILGVCGQSR